MAHPFTDLRYREIAAAHRQAYSSAAPFPHTVIDNFLDPDALREMVREFPTPDGAVWRKHYHDHSKKLAINDITQLGPATRELLWAFNSAAFIDFLEQLTGIDGLIPDPHFEGGGLHLIEPGGFLAVHADFNWHKRLQLDRRVNVLLYLNENWREEYGGALELWSPDMKTKADSIMPIFNRCAVFNTTDFSLHGHPDPLACPPGMSRKSLAFYYYTNGRPESEVTVPHLTLYRRRPGEASSGERRLQRILHKVLPPFVYDLRHALTHRRRATK
jgi:Rps23 Pro-64 3,4-dihydroxylase Tpa1-like proline 4-hydroxylase